MLRLTFDIGLRYSFYLRNEGGQWRTACDLYEHCVDRVVTGAHPDFKPSASRPIGDDILEILLTRGFGATDGVVVDALENDRESSRWKYRENPPYGQYSDAYTRLLQPSVETETPPVRAAACMLLRAKNVPCGEGARLRHSTSEKP